MDDDSAPPPGLGTEKQKLLIVDDEPFNVNLLNALLKPDYKIMVATSGMQALKGAMSGKPDLILLDVMMADMDGYEVCRRLKRDDSTRDIPVIFITAKTAVEDEALGFDLGAVDYISKPFNSSVVRARVRTHMRLKRRGDLLEALVMLDGLTMIPNRRAFDESREREWRRSLRSESPLSAVMMDIDLFKRYNDHYGHSAGDECLIAVAKTLSQCVHRPTDFVARYGGEEFVAILSNTHHEGAMQLGERFRSAVEGLRLPHAQSPQYSCVTLSIGVATTVATAELAVNVLFEAADRMLYEAKEEGRNRVKGVRIDAP